MKKIFAFICFFIFMISLSSSAIINIKTSANQGIYLTPIKITDGYTPIINRELYTSDKNGDIFINLDIYEKYDLIVEFNDTKKYNKIFRENFNFLEVVNLEVMKQNDISLVDRIGNDALKNFIVTGYAVYEKNEEIIIPISSVFVGILLLLFFISIFSRKDSSNMSPEENKIYNENKRKMEMIIENLKEEDMFDIVPSLENSKKTTQEEIDIIDERIRRVTKNEGEFGERKDF